MNWNSVVGRELLAWFAFGSVLFLPTVWAQSKGSPTERVLKDAANGESTVFLDHEERTIPSAFIEALLTDPKRVAKLNRGLKIENAIFDGPLSLRGVKVPVELQWRKSHFSKPVDFSSAHFLGPVDLSGSEFQDPGADAFNFNGMQVDGNLDFRNVTVEGSPQFYHLEIQGDFFASGGRFKDAKATAQFGQAKVAGKMFFGAMPRDRPVYPPAVFDGSLSLADVKTLGLDLNGVTINNNLDLDHADVQTVLQVNQVQCSGDQPESCTPRTVELEGLTYRDLERPEVGDDLKKLLSHAAYSARSYTQLEDYLRTHADPGRADAVFFEMKKQERKSLRGQHLFWSWFLRIIVGYGRSPENALGAAGFMILVGTWIFWKPGALVLRDAKAKRHGDAANPTNPEASPFWYSFDLLTPFIELHQVDTWVPASRWRRNYAQVHRISGWILVPIGVAAITGIIK